MLDKEVTTIGRTCRDCGCSYEARQAKVLDIEFVLDGGGRCPACRAQQDEEEKRKEAEVEQALAKEKRDRWLRTCGIPPKFMGADFNNFKKGLGENNNVLAVKGQCQGYAEDFPIGNPRGYKSLILFSNGVWGIGKTHLAVGITRLVLSRWGSERSSCPVLFVSEPALFRRVQATYNIPDEERGRHETEDDVLRELLSVPLLVLDDVGKEERTDPRFVQRMLFAIINGRYEAMLPMVMTANLTPGQLMLYLGGNKGNEASFDRLVEMCQGQFYEMVGESYRKVIKNG